MREELKGARCKGKLARKLGKEENAANRQKKDPESNGGCRKEVCLKGCRTGWMRASESGRDAVRSAEKCKRGGRSHR